MNIYSGPVFDMARQQFQVIADHIGMPEDERDRLLYPKRAITVPARSIATTDPRRCFRAIACSII